MAASIDTKPIMEDGTDISAQENVSPRSSQVSRQPSTKQQVRHRASVACASCRERRIRCVVPKGENECTQCKRTGTECIIKNDDERRRPISKAYMSSLSDRISLLEGMLKDKGVQPPPAVHPPKTRHEGKSSDGGQSAQRQDAQAKGFSQTNGHSPLGEVPSPPDSANEDFAMHDSDHAADSALTNSQFLLHSLPKETSPFRMFDAKQEDIVHRLLSTKGNLSFDQLSGRLRFFGPTANSHVYAESSGQFDSREPAEQVRRAERIIRSLSADTHDYLMNNFWGYYNSALHIIHQEAFENDRESQNPKFYSSFLHIAILAMGFRFADFDRDDMRRITLGSRESTLHREAKYMLDIELERPGGIPSVQALLLLGDLECGVGRDNTGWMYSGMANRLAFDIGLHLDCRNNGISDLEVDIRHMAMRACVIYDKYWALFLGRPTSIKNQDIGMDLLSRRFSLLSSNPAGSGGTLDEKQVGVEIYEQLIELMELAGRIVETRENHRVSVDRGLEQGAGPVFSPPGEGEDNAYLHVINLDRQLQNWYRRLPDHLQWKPANIKTAPFSYFLLHQQYHVSMILLHRPWAKYGSITGSDGGTSTGSHPSPDSGVVTTSEAPRETPVDHHLNTMNPFSLAGGTHSLGMGGDPHSMVDDSRTSLSRSICTQQAIRVARIFWQHRQRFDGTKISVTGIQHAGTAGIALIAALAYQRSESERRTCLGYLEILASAVGDMSHTYHPAARMDDLLRAVLVQLRTDIGGGGGGGGDANSAASLCCNGGNVTAPAAMAPLVGSDRSAQSDSAWRSNMDSVYSVLPMRRDSAAVIAGDSESEQQQQAPSSKRRRPGNSRRASEYSRPAPPFFAPQPTPPKSSHHRHNSFGQQQQQAVDPAMYSLNGGGGNGLDGGAGNHHHQGFSLDFLDGNTVEHDLEDPTGLEGMSRQQDNGFVLVTNQNDGWGIGGLAPGTRNGGPGPNGPDPRGSNGAYDLPMADWVSGPAGLSASSVLGGPTQNGGGMFGRHDGDKDDGGKGPNGEEAPPPGSGMEWMGSEGGMTALSPVSLSGLVQGGAAVTENGHASSHGGQVHSAGGEKGRDRERDDAQQQQQRNHELDFFSF